MGGERFETTQPEAYLFGENQDLNFLGNRPVAVSITYKYSNSLKLYFHQQILCSFISSFHILPLKFMIPHELWRV